MTEEILRMEPEEGIEKVKETLEMSEYYISVYHEHRNSLEKYFKEDPVVPWGFETSLVFGRLEKFIHQLRVIEVSYCVLLVCLW